MIDIDSEFFSARTQFAATAAYESNFGSHPQTFFCQRGEVESDRFHEAHTNEDGTYYPSVPRPQPLILISQYASPYRCDRYNNNGCHTGGL